MIVKCSGESDAMNVKGQSLAGLNVRNAFARFQHRVRVEVLGIFG
jgi:hypothetical protein